MDYRIWEEDVGFKNNYDPRILAYLGSHQDMLCTFNPEETDKTFCSPRGWEFVNKLIKGYPVTEKDIALISGAISQNVAIDFVEYTKVFAKLIKLEDIVKNPMTKLPNSNEECWATIMDIISKVDKTNFSKVASYVDRFDIIFRLIFYRYILVKHPELQTTPEMTKAMVTLSKYIFPEN